MNVSAERAPPATPEPGRDCGLCPRLAAFRAENRVRLPDGFNAPVPAFGDAGARLVIVGLAPGLHGANRTGRPFTGDYAGELLYATLAKFGFSRGRYGANIDDGLLLQDAVITNAVRCVPPENKPTPLEIRTCRVFHEHRLASFTNARAVICLGKIAHDSTIAAFNLKPASFRFAHGARHAVAAGVTLFDSYHCSRYNTSTGRLTAAMFEEVFVAARAALDS